MDTNRKPAYLATDLDGTLIPLDGNTDNQSDLRKLAQALKQSDIELIFVTGRHFRSVVDAIDDYQLPVPRWIICDVGASVYQCVASDKPHKLHSKHGTSEFDPTDFEQSNEYRNHLLAETRGVSRADIQELLEHIDTLRLQEPEKQGQFKTSFYVHASMLDVAGAEVQSLLDQAQLPFHVVSSIDPFNGDGLVDVLPKAANKAHALAWLLEQIGKSPADIIFSGDSGNDFDAFVAGYRTIIVGNTDRALVRRVYDKHHQLAYQNRLRLSPDVGTSGVLEGLHWFGCLPNSAKSLHGPADRIGATPVTSNEVAFRIWAPRCESLAIEPVATTESSVNGPTATTTALAKDPEGFFQGRVSGLGPGSDYWVVADGTRRPDPAAYSLPHGVHGPTRVVAHDNFPWTDAAWKGTPKRDLVIYELHIGTFTEAGTYRAAIEKLDELKELGVTAIEILPVAQTPGRWNWGYDGVQLFAPCSNYGDPDQLKEFVDACHARELSVILDVVYNHLGPEGNYLREFGPYFSSRYNTPWGEAFNFDGPECGPVRDYILQNVRYWIDEFHMDGLRLDACHFMFDASQPTILQEIRNQVTDLEQAGGRKLHLIAESNVYDQNLLTSDKHSAAYDAIWSDCLMHSIYSQAMPELQLSHRHYSGGPELLEAIENGFLYRHSAEAPERIAERTDALRAASTAHRSSLISGLQTHDSVGNHPRGQRLHQLTSKAYQRAAAAISFLLPSIPMMFMGEEYSAEAPFPFFADFEDPALRQAVDQGRAREYPQHSWGNIPAPSSPETFQSAVLDNSAAQDPQTRSWYQRLASLRKQGLDSGWLTPEHLSVEFDPNLSLFTLEYRITGQACIVLARLGGDNENRSSSAIDYQIPHSVQVVACSLGRFSSETPEVRLHSQHALVFVQENLS